METLFYFTTYTPQRYRLDRTADIPHCPPSEADTPYQENSLPQNP